MAGIGWRFRVIALSLAGYLIAGLLGGPIAAAAELELRKLTRPEPVPSARVSPKALEKADETAKRNWRPDTKSHWPQGGSVVADVTPAGKRTRVAKAGSLPLSVTVPKGKHPRGRGATTDQAQVQVQVLDRRAAKAAGIDGVLMAVQGHGDRPGKGRLDLKIDYSGFAGMYGGDWASRLTLREMPACVLTTPGERGCVPGKVVDTRNDLEKATLAAEVDTDVVPQSPAAAGEPVRQAPAMLRSASGTMATANVALFAVTASSSGPTGDYAATPLSPSASWGAGGSSGGFSWTYDIDTPAVPGGLKPTVGLSYASQAVDGRTAATNNQSNWVGDGWSLSPGFIERRYVPCETDKKDGNNPSHKVGDQCWKKDNATLSLGGAAGELVKDDATGSWHKKQDDGTRVDLLKSSNRRNGDADGEYWRVTAPDGTRYYFGYNRLPGWSSGKEVTNSTMTVPVYGNHPGEPCHATAFKDSWCQQGWRWNLDYVVDPHSNAMAYYWAKEGNYYQRNIDSDTFKGTMSAYTRGSYLKRIEYGLRSDRMYADEPAAKVEFTVSERCLPTSTFDCASAKFTEANAKYWPDVPFDQYCTSGSACEGNSSPSYFTRKRLTGITTWALDGSSFKKVDSWELRQTLPLTGDGTDPSMWLKGIKRTGHTSGSPITLPEVVMYGTQMPNRVENATTRDGQPDPLPHYNRYRVYAIKNETGSTLGVTYSGPGCTAANVSPPASNGKRCFPVMWSPPDAPAADYKPYLDWFHSYVVTQVLESDNTSGALTKRTDYTYTDLDWAKSDDEFTPADQRTWGDRRGYALVQAKTGDPAQGTQTLTETRYFRGIAGAQVADGEGAKVSDHEAFAGMPRETATYNGVGGDLISATSYTPWASTPTASRARTADKLPAIHAYRVGTAKDETRTAVTGGKLRRTRTERTFDSHGMLSTSSDTGDTAKSGDERCTTTTYARNTDTNLLNAVAQVRTVAKACGTTPSLPADLIGTKRSYYDGSTHLGAAPTKGDITLRTENDGAGTGYQTVSRATYDAYGRQTSATDAAGAKTTVAYTPATGQAPEKTVTTNALGHASTAVTDSRRGVTTTALDANGNRADIQYDALGRVTKVWAAGWPKADYPKLPSAEYDYRISKSEPNVVTAKQLQHDGSYLTSYTFYDGLLRPRETQAPAIGVSNGRVVTETQYDTRGLAWKTYSPYFADGKPSTTLYTGVDHKVPAAVETRFDGAARPVAAIARKYGDETMRTLTQYGGDRTTVIPPKGGTAITTITDALGRKTERRTYTDPARSAYQTTKYGYDPRGHLAELTDPAGISWTWEHDARGRQTATNDPDKGRSTTTYDIADRPVTATDARGTKLTTVYDALGRNVELKQGSTLRAKWTYDTVAKGLASTDTRYVNGQAYTTRINGYTERNQPVSSTVTLPSGAGSVAGTYTWEYGYNKYNGTQEWVQHPAIANLPAEYVTTVLGEGNLPTKTVAGGAVLVSAVNRDVFGKPVRTEYGAFGRKVYRTQDYDEHTGALTRNTLDGDELRRVEDTTYSYDLAGNVTRISSTSGEGTAARTDRQCFRTDSLRRLTQAWTTKSATQSCSTSPTTSNVGGMDPYWQEYAYDLAGNRSKLVEHGTSSGLPTITRTATTGKTSEAAPHALRSMVTTGGPADGTKETFSYDAAGNTTERKGGERDQKLTWDAEGNLASVTQSGKRTSYDYDSGGNRILAHDADGTTTAYLPNGNELSVSASGTKTGTRYYQHEGETVAVRTPKKITLLFGDQQGSAMIAIGWAAGQGVLRRKQYPFGSQRASAGTSWPGSRGFVGGTTDPTGLTHLGAREYDSSLGRFLSVDPLLITDDPSQLNPYVYGNNNAATFADPSGEAYMECWSGQYNCTYGPGGTADIKEVDYGRNYEYETAKRGGDTAPGYVKRQRKYQRQCSKDPSCTSTSVGNQGRSMADINADREAERKAAEEQSRKNSFTGRLQSALSGATAWVSRNWDTIKTVSSIVGFGACLVMSAGLCMAVGAGIALAKFIGEVALGGSSKEAGKALAKELAWVAVGGASAAAFGRAAGGSSSWRNAFFEKPIVRYSKSYRTKVPGVKGPGGGRKSRVLVDDPQGAIDVRSTYANVTVNSVFNVAFCGSGNASLGALPVTFSGPSAC
ncbi:RHS repeat domain-containing protein [Streptomyces sp. NPDC006879]|uniref:RHS repeat domain-containing protein n=1 Tax=Streptomyces sp. NPDC006879 TaxID=3364767 RepID=UPI0036C59F59